MAIFHCVFIERSLRRKGVFHSILLKYSIIVAVLGCGHSCLTVVCSCVFPSVASLGSVSSSAGREGGRISADRRFSSSWIQEGWHVSIVFHSRTIQFPLSQSSCTCPSVNSIRCFSFPDLKGAVKYFLCTARRLFSRHFTASGLLKKVCMASVCSWNSTKSGLGSGRCVALPQQLKTALAMSTCAYPT